MMMTYAPRQCDYDLVPRDTQAVKLIDRVQNARQRRVRIGHRAEASVSVRAISHQRGVAAFARIDQWAHAIHVI